MKFTRIASGKNTNDYLTPEQEQVRLECADLIVKNIRTASLKEKEEVRKKLASNPFATASDYLFRFSAPRNPGFGIDAPQATYNRDDEEENAPTEEPQGEEEPQVPGQGEKQFEEVEKKVTGWVNTQKFNDIDAKLKEIVNQNKNNPEQKTKLIVDALMSRNFNRRIGILVSEAAFKYTRGLPEAIRDDVAQDVSLATIRPENFMAIAKKYTGQQPIFSAFGALLLLNVRNVKSNAFNKVNTEEKNSGPSLDNEMGGNKGEGGSSYSDILGGTTDEYDIDEEQDNGDKPPKLVGRPDSEYLKKLLQYFINSPTQQRKIGYKQNIEKIKQEILSSEEQERRLLEENRAGMLGNTTGVAPGVQPRPADESMYRRKRGDESVWEKKNTKQYLDSNAVRNLMDRNAVGHDELTGIMNDISTHPSDVINHSDFDGIRNTGPGKNMLAHIPLLLGDTRKIDAISPRGKAIKVRPPVSNMDRQRISNVIMRTFLDVYREYVSLKDVREIDESGGKAKNRTYANMFPKFVEEAKAKIEAMTQGSDDGTEPLPPDVAQRYIKEIDSIAPLTFFDWIKKADPWIRGAHYEQGRRAVTQRDNGTDAHWNELTPEQKQEIIDHTYTSMYQNGEVFHARRPANTFRMYPLKKGLPEEAIKGHMNTELGNLANGRTDSEWVSDLPPNHPHWARESAGAETAVGPMSADQDTVASFINENVRTASGIKNLIKYAYQLEEIGEYDTVDEVDFAVLKALKK